MARYAYLITCRQAGRVIDVDFICTREEEFVRFLLAYQAEPPPSFARMKRLNQEGPAVLGSLPDRS